MGKYVLELISVVNNYLTNTFANMYNLKRKYQSQF